ncbi:hypothetical protein BJ684DRAFT_1348, partial [Piptocephalis cylindrospora]
QQAASKANFIFPASEAFSTGGSWKKSPVRTSWMPPNGEEGSRSLRATCSSLSSRTESNMDTSSITRTRV